MAIYGAAGRTVKGTAHMARVARLCILTLVVLCMSMVGIAGADPPLITGEQIADDSVTGADVLESSLAVVPEAAVARDLSNRDIQTSSPTVSFTSANEWFVGVPVICPEGQFAVSGGARVSSGVSASIVMVGSEPGNTGGPGRSWNVYYRDAQQPPGGSSAEIVASAVCAGGAS